MYKKLSEYLLVYAHQIHQKPDLRQLERRLGAALLLEAAHGREQEQHPAMVNLAALALSMPRITAHRLDTAAIAQVQESSIDTLPSAPPALMASGWLIESADLSVPLYNDVVCLGGYQIEGRAWVVGLRYPDGVFVGPWSPRWGQSDVEGAFLDDLALFVERDDSYREDTIAGIAFAITLGALLEADATPLTEREVKFASGVPKRKPTPKNRNPLAWSVRQVSLNPASVPVPADTEGSTGATGEGIRDGLHAEKRPIRGYLRRQPHGPGRSERKWVYVASFESTRYVGERPVRVHVTGRE